jgi:hypothetical protein
LSKSRPLRTGRRARTRAGTLVSISGQSLSVEWSVTGAVPGEQLQLVMLAVAASSTGANKSFTFATVQVSPQCTAGSTASAMLAPDYYSIGLTVVDPSTNANRTVFTSDPASAQVVIASSDNTQPQTTTATGNSLSYSLVPLPVYLDKKAPSNYSFREGGALIVVYGTQLRVTTSFLGAADTQFFMVVQTAHQNITAGAVTTASSGGGVFKGNVTLSPGTYQVGLLVYVSGNTASPVGVSIPRAIQVTLPPTTGTSSSTSTRSSESRSSSSNGENSTTTTSTNETTTTSSSTSESSHLVNELQLAPVKNSSAPGGYLYGEGKGGYAVTGGSVYFSLAFTGQNPHAR